MSRPRDEWVRPYLRRYGKALALAIVLGVVTSLFACALMFTSGYMISLAAAVPLTVLALHVPSLFVRIFGIGKPLMRYGERLSSHDWVFRMMSEMRRKLYLVLARRTSALGDGAGQTTLGQVLALLTDDIGHVQDLILRGALPLVCAWLLTAAVLAGCGALSWQLLAIMAATLVLAAVVAPLVSATASRARIMAAANAQAHLYDELTDDVLGLADWMLSGRHDDYLHRLDDHLRIRDDARASVRAFDRRLRLATQVLFCLCMIGVLVWASCVFCDGATGSPLLATIAATGSENAPAYPPNWMAAFVLCLFPLMEALAPLPDAAQSYIAQHGALERLNAMSGTPDRTGAHDAAAPHSPDETRLTPRSDSSPHEQHTEAMLPACPAIELRDVSFAYDDGCPIIEGMTLTIPFGRTLAIRGESGAGKTTLAKLIYGDVRPSAGEVRVGEIDPTTLGANKHTLIGVLEQQPKLFDMTLRENLRIGKPDATDDALRDALHSVGLTDRFERMPHGLDSRIQEGAFNLSGGEAHRLALARLLLADAPIIILDEPFAALDAATEQMVLDTVMRVFRGKTVIAITHSPTTAAAMDDELALTYGMLNCNP